jgi:hypothetical protein
MASIGALVGHDETSRFEEATRLGILPGYSEFQAVFMALIPREQQPKVSYALELCRYNLHYICDSYLRLGYMQLNV